MARQLSPKTQAIHGILERTKGAATFAESQQELAKQGITVDSNAFSVVKSNWRKKNSAAPAAPTGGKKRGRPKGSTNATHQDANVPDVTDTEALDFLREMGGSMEKATAYMAKEQVAWTRKVAVFRRAKSLSAMFTS